MAKIRISSIPSLLRACTRRLKDVNNISQETITSSLCFGRRNLSTICVDTKRSIRLPVSLPTVFVSRLDRAESYRLSSTRSVTSCSGSPIKSDLSQQSSTCREIRVPAPYGHVAAKEWGNPNGKHKVLCIHGWLDNAGSFDPMLPHLIRKNDDYHYVAIDLPGTGYSSHKPVGSDQSKFTFVIDAIRLIRHMRWDKFSLIGHSLGSHISFMIACLYPDSVLNFVSLDRLHPIIQPVHRWNVRSARSIEDFFKFESLIKDTDEVETVYTENQALERLMEAHMSSLTEESARIMMIRGAKKRQDGKFIFRRDIRLKIGMIDPWLPEDLNHQYLHVFRPNLLVIRARNGPYEPSEETRLKFYNLYKKQCKVFRDVELDGTHHLHMNTPEPASQVIDSFFELVNENS